MNDTFKKLISILLGFLFINLILKSCNNFNVIKQRNNYV